MFGVWCKSKGFRYNEIKGSDDVNYSITLDLQKANTQHILNAVKGDVGNSITATFTNSGEAYSLSGKTVKFTALKSDGTFMYEPTEISGDTATFTDTTGQLCAVGDIVKASFIVMEGSTIKASPQIFVVVNLNVDTTRDVVSSVDELRALNVLVAQIEYNLANHLFDGQKGDKGDKGDRGPVGSVEGLDELLEEYGFMYKVPAFISSSVSFIINSVEIGQIFRIDNGVNDGLYLKISSSTNLEDQIRLPVSIFDNSASIADVPKGQFLFYQGKLYFKTDDNSGYIQLYPTPSAVTNVSGFDDATDMNKIYKVSSGGTNYLVFALTTSGYITQYRVSSYNASSVKPSKIEYRQGTIENGVTTYNNWESAASAFNAYTSSEADETFMIKAKRVPIDSVISEPDVYSSAFLSVAINDPFYTYDETNDVRLFYIKSDSSTFFRVGSTASATLPIVPCTTNYQNVKVPDVSDKSFLELPAGQMFLCETETEVYKRWVKGGVSGAYQYEADIIGIVNENFKIMKPVYDAINISGVPSVPKGQLFTIPVSSGGSIVTQLCVRTINGYIPITTGSEVII